MNSPEAISSCSFGNGLCVYKERIGKGLSKRPLPILVAHISVNRQIIYKDNETLTKEDILYIEHLSKTDDRTISTSQTEKVFNIRPYEEIK